jgi:hypothetical protein
MSVRFHRVVGTLIACDNDELLGIIRRRMGLDRRYEVVRRSGSTIEARCPTSCHRDCVLQIAAAGTQNEAIASLAASIASARDRVAVRLLDESIARRGCPACLALWSPMRPSVPPPTFDYRDRLRQLGRWMCRKLCTCVEHEGFDSA